MSTFLNRSPYRRARRSSIVSGFDPVLTGAVIALLILGTLLVYAATRDWYSANGLDPQYYLKRHVINIVIGLALAWGTTIIDTDFCALIRLISGALVSLDFSSS
jgi:rod shape determining protein RodA